MPLETLNELLERAAGVSGTGLRLVDRRERSQWVGWDDVHRSAVEVAGGLRGLGIEPGQRVALIYPTGREFFAAFFGT